MRSATQAHGHHAAGQKQKSSHNSTFFLTALLLLVSICVVLFVFRPAAKALPVPEQPRIVRLDAAWTSQLANCGGDKEVKAFIDQTVAEIAATPFGINAIAWDGMTPDGAAMFIDSTETLPHAACLSDRFDAMDYLIRTANDADLTVYLESLLPKPEDKAITDLVEKHEMPLVSRNVLSSQTPGWESGDVQLLDASIGGERAALALQQGSEARGVMLGDWSVLRQDPSEVVLFNAFADSALDDPTQAWAGKELAQTLAVTYPQHDNAKLYDKTVFLMGTSNPDAPLTLNGQPVERFTQRGSWGILVPLEYGTNTFTLENGGKPLEFHIEKPKPDPSKKPAKPQPPQPDGTAGAEAIGKKVQVTDAIASALTEPWKSSSIEDTLYQGAVAEVVDVTEYQSGNIMTHAYKLSTGGWVRAKTSTIVDLPDAAFTGATISEDAASRSTVLEFAGSGTPAVYHTWEDNKLTLKLLSAQWSGTLPESERFAASIEQQDKDIVLTLDFSAADPLYGWAVNYEDGVTRLYFKHKPVLAEGAKPLTGLTIMLDPGHGEGDDGAVGSGGLSAPVEKDANLALALAVRTRLEQLGATVAMTRTEDTFPTLGDRVTALNTQHPDLFISIHHNSIDLTRDVNGVNGTEAYWFYDEGTELAKLLTENVTSAINAVRSEPHQDRGNSYGYYYVTRSNICPATLLEVAFMTNPADYELCTDADVIWAEAGGIARAVYQFLREAAIQPAA